MGCERNVFEVVSGLTSLFSFDFEDIADERSLFSSRQRVVRKELRDIEVFSPSILLVYVLRRRRYQFF